MRLWNQKTFTMTLPNNLSIRSALIVPLWHCREYATGPRVPLSATARNALHSSTDRSLTTCGACVVSCVLVNLSAAFAVQRGHVMPTADDLIGCVCVLTTIAGICLAWLVFFAAMIGG